MSNLDTKHFIYFPRKEPLIIDKYQDADGKFFADFTYGGRIDKDTGAIIDPMQQIMFQLGGGGTGAVSSVNGKTGDVVLTGSDINVSESDTTTIAGKIANQQGLIEGNTTAINQINTQMSEKLSNVSCNNSLQSNGFSNDGVAAIVVLLNDTTDNNLFLKVSGSSTFDSVGESDEFCVDIYDADGNYVDYMDLDEQGVEVNGNVVTFNVNQVVKGLDTSINSFTKGYAFHLYDYDLNKIGTLDADFEISLIDESKIAELGTVSNGICDITNILPDKSADKMKLQTTAAPYHIGQFDTTGQLTDQGLTANNANSNLDIYSDNYGIEIMGGQTQNQLVISKFFNDSVGPAGTTNIKFTENKTYDLDNSGGTVPDFDAYNYGNLTDTGVSIYLTGDLASKYTLIVLGTTSDYPMLIQGTFDSDQNLTVYTNEDDLPEGVMEAMIIDYTTTMPSDDIVPYKTLGKTNDLSAVGLSLTEGTTQDELSVTVTMTSGTQKTGTVDIPKSGGTTYTAGTDIEITSANVINWTEPDDYLSRYYPGTTQDWAGVNANGFIWYGPDGTTLLATDGDEVNYKSKGEIATTSQLPKSTSTTIALNGQYNWNGLNITFVETSGFYELQFTASGNLTGNLDMITISGGMPAGTLSGQVVTLVTSAAGLYLGSINDGTHTYIISGAIWDGTWQATLNIQEI